MISTSLAVDRRSLSLPNHHHNHHNHHHHHHHPNAGHSMAFGEPFLLPPAGPTPKPAPAEFLRPLPKPGPRYNGAPLNGCRTVSHNTAPRVSTTVAKYPSESGAVNLTKDEPESSEPPSQYVTSSYRFPVTQSYYPSPYLYPPQHYNQILSRTPYQAQAQKQQTQQHVDAYRHQSPPAPTSPGQFVPPTSTFSPPQSPSVRQGHSPQSPGGVRPGQSMLITKKFKVPSGKEGSMKHRILTRPDTSPKRRAMIHPPSFTKGSLIQLANGELKKVEDMRTEDFVSSAEKSEALQLDPSTVVRIAETQSGVLLTLSYGEHRSQVDFETTVENPFFVFGQGWSSYAPDRSHLTYGLNCHRLQVGDVCISLTPRDTKRPLDGDVDSTAPRKRRWSAPEPLSDDEDAPNAAAKT